MSRIGVLVAAAVVVAACRDDAGGANGAGKGKASGEGSGTVSAMGVVSSVQPDKVQVKTADGRQLALKMSDGVKVTLAGGEAQTAVITEGAPVRVAYRPKGEGGELVTIDVEPKAGGSGGEAKPAPQGGEAKPAPQGGAPADASRARQGG